MIPRVLKQWLAQPSVTPMMLKAFAVGAFSLALIIPLALIAMPYIEFFNDMAMQPKGRSQMVWFKEGPPERQAIPGMLQPPPGAVAQSLYPYPYPSAEPKVAELAASQMAQDSVPLPAVYRAPAPTAQTMKRGKNLYDIYCIVCHGEQGVGDGTVAKKGFPAPPQLQADRARQYSDERLFHIITMGQNVMPAYRSQVRPEDRWNIVHYVRALQRAYGQTKQGDKPAAEATEGATNLPAQPSPDKPSPDKPSPDKPSPDKPSPGKPSPGKPSPGKPTQTAGPTNE